MTLYQQRRVVAVSAMVVFSLGAISRITTGKEQFDEDAARFYIGLGITFTFISIFTDLGLEVGAGFALLVMVAAFMNYGEDVFKFLTKRGQLNLSAKQKQRKDKRNKRKARS